MAQRGSWQARLAIYHSTLTFDSHIHSRFECILADVRENTQNTLTNKPRTLLDW